MLNIGNEKMINFKLIVHYKDKTYESILLNATDNSPHATLLNIILESGIDTIKVLQFPVGPNKLVVFTQAQLCDTVVEIEYDEVPVDQKKLA